MRIYRVSRVIRESYTVDLDTDGPATRAEVLKACQDPHTVYIAYESVRDDKGIELPEGVRITPGGHKP